MVASSEQWAELDQADRQRGAAWRGSALSTGLAARASAEAVKALTFNPDHLLGADHLSHVDWQSLCKCRQRRRTQLR
jgi:hypothetical protein